MFITIEGGERVGKTTLAQSLGAKLEAAGRPVLVLREPGGTVFGEAVRRLFLDPEVHPGPVAEALLVSASRADLVTQIIRPALIGGGIVICDRYIDTTYAYQGYGRGVPRQMLRQINHLATNGLEPDVTLLLDAPPEIALARNTGALDRIEQEALAFHQRVRSGYLELASWNPRFRTIDASQEVDKVLEAAMRHLDKAAPFYLAERRP